MKCKEPVWPDNREFLREFNRRSGQLRIPLSGSLEVTSQCNLRCIHCYLGPEPAAGQHAREMSTGKILSVIDEITEAGCLDLLLTGGEPLLRKDFRVIYSHAKRNGLLVTVFSNGTLVTEDVVSLFVDLPPKTVELSLYGATEETYKNISRVQGSYERCLQGIHLLQEAGIRIKLKTILMTLNRHEFFLIEAIARDLGVKFRFDAMIFPKLNGDKSPLSLRVSPEEAVDREFSDPARYDQWKSFYDHRGSCRQQDTLYTCGAGMTGFHIDSSGRLKPCLMAASYEYDLNKGAFSIGWRDVIPLIRGKKPENGFRCRGCQNASLCGYCPPFFALENGREDICSEYLCKMGINRYNKLSKPYTDQASQKI